MSDKRFQVLVKIEVRDENNQVVGNFTKGTSSMTQTQLESFIQRQNEATNKVIRETF